MTTTATLCLSHCVLNFMHRLNCLALLNCVALRANWVGSCVKLDAFATQPRSGCCGLPCPPEVGGAGSISVIESWSKIQPTLGLGLAVICSYTDHGVRCFGRAHVICADPPVQAPFFPQCLRWPGLPRPGLVVPACGALMLTHVPEHAGSAPLFLNVARWQ